MTDLKQYVPHIYDGFLETDALIGAENELFDELAEKTAETINNQFIMTAEHSGLVRFENLFGIKANTATESIDFRRQRLINRFSTRGPFTIPFLREKLDSIIGVGQYSLYVDYSASTLYVESSAVNQAWYNEIYITINNTKPAAMVFVNKPVTTVNVLLSEEISITTLTYNYRIGTTWKLGQKPFADREDKGLIKMASTPSVQAGLLEDTAKNISEKLVRARVNDTLDITDNINKIVAGNVATIEFNVSIGQGIDTITNIKTFNANGDMYSNADVYVPVIEDVTIKHNIRAREG